MAAPGEAGPASRGNRADMREQPAVARMIERLTHVQSDHGQQSRLHVPREDEPFEAARPLLLTLGAPTFGLSFAISVLTTYGPVVLISLTSSPSVVGVLIGAEGAFALVVPLLAGVLSDRLPGSSAARRLPFVLLGAPLVVAGLALLPFSGGLGVAALAVLAFFVGYYLYYPPYRAIYADLLPRRSYARAQASQAILRGAGLGVALLAGGLLLPIWRPLPFAIAALAVVVTTFALAPLLGLDTRPASGTARAATVSLRRLLLGSGDLRTFAVANALWEFSFSGLKSFIVLYVVHGLGRSTAVASAAIAAVAVSYIAGAPLAGRLADRYGIVRVLRVSALVYGAGLVFGVFPHTLPPMLILLPFVALAGAIVLTLPQALAFTLAPPGSEGAAAGLQDFSRGVGVVLGPIAVGGAIELFRGEFSSTDGYAVMWLVIGIPVLASVLLLRRLRTAA
jgi:MFS family permease